MRIVRHCGKERLSGGTRLWIKMAKIAEFDGELRVYGWGTVGQPGREQRTCLRDDALDATVADYSPRIIRVWLPCSCAAVDFDRERLLEKNRDPLTNFGHELGHHRQHLKNRDRWTSHAESAAERYGRMMVRSLRKR